MNELIKYAVEANKADVDYAKRNIGLNRDMYAPHLEVDDMESLQNTAIGRRG